MDIRNITLHENGKWRLQKSFGIHGVALDWFRSYLVGRTQYVRRGSARSSIVYLTCCVPQGSVLGPILFIMYTADLVSLVQRYELSPHLYADDTQIYGSCSPSCDADSFLTRVSQCTCAVAEWMQSNRLQLNCARRTSRGSPTIAAYIGCPLYGSDDRLGYSRPVPVIVRPGSPHRCRPDDADPGSADCLSWIRCTAPST